MRKLKTSGHLINVRHTASLHLTIRVSANTEIIISRTAHNRKQIMSMLRAVVSQLNPSEIAALQTLGLFDQDGSGQQQTADTEPPMVAEFWGSVEYLESLNGVSVNHSADPGLLAINLPHIEACARAAGIQLPPRTELNRLLDKSVRYEFLGRRAVRSKLMEKNVKCLVFKNIN